jgi:hypothetical protein
MFSVAARGHGLDLRIHWALGKRGYVVVPVQAMDTPHFPAIEVSERRATRDPHLRDTHWYWSRAESAPDQDLTNRVAIPTALPELDDTTIPTWRRDDGDDRPR